MGMKLHYFHTSTTSCAINFCMTLCTHISQCITSYTPTRHSGLLTPQASTGIPIRWSVCLWCCCLCCAKISDIVFLVVVIIVTAWINQLAMTVWMHYNLSNYYCNDVVPWYHMWINTRLFSSFFFRWNEEKAKCLMTSPSGFKTGARHKLTT